MLPAIGDGAMETSLFARSRHHFPLFFLGGRGWLRERLGVNSIHYFYFFFIHSRSWICCYRVV